MSSMTIPDEKTCLDMLRRENTPEHIIAHSIQVWRVAKVIGEALILKGVSLNIDLLRAACLLHDIAKFPCIQSGQGYHDAVGQKMMDKEGLPDIGRIVAQHVLLRNDNGESISEEHVVNYSDKRVVHDKIVDLDERFAYLNETYGKHPEASKYLEKMKDKTKNVEDRIFQLLSFQPQDVAGIIESQKDEGP